MRRQNNRFAYTYRGLPNWLRVLLICLLAPQEAAEEETNSAKVFMAIQSLWGRDVVPKIGAGNQVPSRRADRKQQFCPSCFSLAAVGWLLITLTSVYISMKGANALLYYKFRDVIWQIKYLCESLCSISIFETKLPNRRCSRLCHMALLFEKTEFYFVFANILSYENRYQQSAVCLSQQQLSYTDCAPFAGLLLWLLLRLWLAWPAGTAGLLHHMFAGLLLMCNLPSFLHFS